MLFKTMSNSIRKLFNSQTYYAELNLSALIQVKWNEMKISPRKSSLYQITCNPKCH